MLGLKLKADLIPLLGNELAVTLPMKAFDVTPQPQKPRDEQGVGASLSATTPEKEAVPATPSPTIAIGIKDREAVRLLLPRIIEAVGFKGAALLAQTERRDDTEMVTYGDALAYAFVGDFLVLSPDVAAVRHVIDSYLKHETLSSDHHYRNATRWQPRQVQAQVYVSPALMESYNSFARSMTGSVNQKLQEYLLGISPTAEPVSYALSNEGTGPLHELHVPKTLVTLMVAGLSGASEESTLALNEAFAQTQLRVISSAEATYQATQGKGSFGSLDELLSADLLNLDQVAKYGYRIQILTSGDGFEASAVPREYGKTGKMSFFIDHTSVLRGGDHGGGPATASDKPVQ
jgi:hypothetical protein